MTYLLDGNVLVALVVGEHVHHRRAVRWFGSDRLFATCPATQGTLLRFLLREGVTAVAALEVLQALTGRDGHSFWPDDLGYVDVDLAGVVGHRQVTDAYLAALARSRSAHVASFDGGLCAAHPDVAVAIPG